MSNNVIQFPDKKKNVKEDLDNITNELLTSVINIHDAVGCVFVIVKEKDAKKFDLDTYAGGRPDIFELLCTHIEKSGLKQVDGITI